MLTREDLAARAGLEPAFSARQADDLPIDERAVDPNEDLGVLALEG